MSTAGEGRIRLLVDGRPVETATSGGRRLLDLLRDDLGLTGTKEGCGEGECGACAVLLDGVLVNSCLVPLAQADGRLVTTIEGLAADARWSGLRRSFLEHGGTQCGMCAPGMLMAARALLAGGGPAGEAEIREAIAGTLCRCTGYTKVLESIAAAAEEPAGPVSPGEDDRVPLHAFAATPLRPPRPAPEVLRVDTLAQALAAVDADPSIRPLAGGTDMMVQLAEGPTATRATTRLLDLDRLGELRRIETDGDELVLGALVTWTSVRRAPLVAAALPALAEVAGTVGAAAIRNRGTLGGSCCTASPAGDLAPLLLATDARLVATSLHGHRTISAAAFWPAYRRTALAPGELLTAIRIPLAPAREIRVRKVGARRALAIAKVSLALGWQEDATGRWRAVRVALGSVAPTPIRARATEELLEDRTPDAGLAEEAAQTLAAEISPIDDIRSTAAYRRAVAGAVLRRFLLDAAGTTGWAEPSRPGPSRVE